MIAWEVKKRRAQRGAACAVFYPPPLDFLPTPLQGGVLPPHIHNIYVIGIYKYIQ